jgi:phage terminase large subunit-like protein
VETLRKKALKAANDVIKDIMFYFMNGKTYIWMMKNVHIEIKSRAEQFGLMNEHHSNMFRPGALRGSLP